MWNDKPNDLPKLWLNHLDNPRRSGKELVCTCPVCHTRHLYVNPYSGLFKCFYAGCPFKGIAEDKKDDLKTYKAPWQRRY